MQSRMLTTAMLTQLNELRRRQRCVFFVATNRITAFDSAVTRPGRFDMILLVGTPSLAARIERLDAKLAAAALDGPAHAEVRSVLLGVLRDTWGAELQFFNFIENER
jgi:SpoVK/Ycf46/Vps4 family AAA+-type ATPase